MRTRSDAERVPPLAQVRTLDGASTARSALTGGVGDEPVAVGVLHLVAVAVDALAEHLAVLVA